VNTVTASFHTTMRQMTAMSQWPKCLSKKSPKYLSEKNPRCRSYQHVSCYTSRLVRWWSDF